MTRDEIMTMDEDALRLAVAKRCGWTDIISVDGEDWIGLPPNHNYYGALEHFPDYPRDIAAAYELEDALPEEKHAQYAIYLYDIILRKGVWWDWSMIHASAADRCRAWLMTMEG